MDEPIVIPKFIKDRLIRIESKLSRFVEHYEQDRIDTDERLAQIERMLNLRGGAQ
jgi:hypothetical protein